MARIEFARKAAGDIKRIFDYLAQHNSYSASARIQEILQSITLLEHNPMIGRMVKNGKRELVVGRGQHAIWSYIVTHRYAPEIGTVFVLAIRGQRELRYT
jgi:plasmid stabilization system protein ParE